MSISFFFDGDDRTCDTFTCSCTYDGPAHPKCTECKGTGVVSIWTDTHQVNMSNGNAFAVMEAIKLPVIDHCGTIDAQLLVQRCADLTWMLRSKLDVRYVKPRVDALFELASAALKKGQRVINWG